MILIDRDFLIAYANSSLEALEACGVAYS